MRVPVVRRVLDGMHDADALAEAQALAVNEIIAALTDEDAIRLPPAVAHRRPPASGRSWHAEPAREPNAAALRE